jgi:hypothetical protein
MLFLNIRKRLQTALLQGTLIIAIWIEYSFDFYSEPKILHLELDGLNIGYVYGAD